MDATGKWVRGVKRLVLRSKLLTILAAVVTNYGIAVAAKLRPVSRSARTAEPLDIPKTLAKFEKEFGAHLSHAGIASLAGKRVLEIGTGSHLLTPLKCLALGAKSVVSIDKFACLRPEREQAALYRAFRKRLPPTERKRLDRSLTFTTDGFSTKRLEYRLQGIEDIRESEEFDLIISSFVFEHVYDIDAALERCERALKPGGVFSAWVGWHDHGLFSIYHDPLFYLRIPEWLWVHMAKRCGRVNRRSPKAYREALERLGMRYTIAVSRLKVSERLLDPPQTTLREGVQYTRSYRRTLERAQRSLRKEFRDLPLHDLMADWFLVVARKR